MSTGEAFGRTIQLFLVDGKPTGLRKATIDGWTGLLCVSGASAFGDLTARDEVDRTGVYILSGPDPDKAGATRAYIGSGNSGYVQQTYGGLKEKLIADSVLTPHTADRLRFAKPWSFTSPSAAAAVVLDRNSNGRIEWKVQGSKRSYHDWQHAQATNQEAVE